MFKAATCMLLTSLLSVRMVCGAQGDDKMPASGTAPTPWEPALGSDLTKIVLSFGLYRDEVHRLGKQLPEFAQYTTLKRGKYVELDLNGLKQFVQRKGFGVEGLRVSGIPEGASNPSMNGFYERVDLESSTYPETYLVKNLTVKKGSSWDTQCSRVIASPWGKEPGTTLYYRHQSGRYVIVRSINKEEKLIPFSGHLPVWSFRRVSLDVRRRSKLRFTAYAPILPEDLGASCNGKFQNSYNPISPSDITSWRSTPSVWPSTCRGTLYDKDLKTDSGYPYFKAKTFPMRLRVETVYE